MAISMVTHIWSMIKISSALFSDTSQSTDCGLVLRCLRDVRISCCILHAAVLKRGGKEGCCRKFWRRFALGSVACQLTFCEFRFRLVRRSPPCWSGQTQISILQWFHVSYVILDILYNLPHYPDMVPCTIRLLHCWGKFELLSLTSKKAEASSHL